MAGWNAALCEGCWNDIAGDRVPVRVKSEVGYPPETCSRCGIRTFSGIYRRIKPEDQNFYTPPTECTVCGMDIREDQAIVLYMNRCFHDGCWNRLGQADRKVLEGTDDRV